MDTTSTKSAAADFFPELSQKAMTMNQIEIAVQADVADIEIKEITLDALAAVAGGFDGYNLY